MEVRNSTKVGLTTIVSVFDIKNKLKYKGTNKTASHDTLYVKIVK